MRITIKNFLSVLLITIVIPHTFSQILLRNKQTNSKPQFTITDPGQINVFVKNYGQFDQLLRSGNEKPNYVINGSNYISFTPHGCTWIIHKPVKNKTENKETEREHRVLSEAEREEERNLKIESYIVNMNWEGANPDAQLIAEEQADGYYTYAMETYRDLKAKGYRKLIYKELYPGIDVEYVIPQDEGAYLSDRQGVKYSLIIKPGADIKKVKMYYEGDFEKMELDAKGNVVIETPAGNMIDHAPESFYQGSKKGVPSSFEVKNKTVSFKLTSSIDLQQTLIIDPWTISPNMFGGSGPYDVAYDKYGNIYIDFINGVSPPQISKYTPSGTFLWTINMGAALIPSFSKCYYSDLCVIPSGSVFIASGIGYNLCKISSAGLLLTTVTWPWSMNDEGWVVEYNHCLNILLIGGAGINNSICLRMGVDTALAGTLTGNNFNGGLQSGNDMARMLIDDNGDMYSYFTNYNNYTGTANTIFKSVPPYTTFIYSKVRTMSYFDECASFNRQTNRLNVMDINSSYLYFFDGKNIEARNKISGNLISSIVVSPTYGSGNNYMFPGPADYKNEGIAVDECNNVYVGGQKSVHVFNFNGSIFTTLATMAVPGNVYDIMLDRSKQLIYVTGDGFLSSLNALPCNPDPLVITPTSAGTCTGNGIASVTVSGGTAPYTYRWSNGSITNNITAAPGTYTVTVTDGSCRNPHSDTSMVTITPSSSLVGLFTKGTANCPGCGCKQWVMLTASGGASPYTYTWPDGYDKRYKNQLCPGSYTINIKDKNGCSVNVNLSAP